MDYQKYLRSKHWKKTRKKKLKEAGSVCERCRRDKATQVHHLHYGSLHREKMEDLQVVCRPCHEKIHNVETTPAIQTLGFNCLLCPSKTCEVLHGPNYIYRVCLGCGNQTKKPKRKWKSTKQPKLKEHQARRRTKKKRRGKGSKSSLRDLRKRVRRKKKQERERITFESLARKKFRKTS